MSSHDPKRANGTCSVLSFFASINEILALKECASDV